MKVPHRETPVRSRKNSNHEENPMGLVRRHLLRHRLPQARPRHVGLCRRRPSLGRLRRALAHPTPAALFSRASRRHRTHVHLRHSRRHHRRAPDAAATIPASSSSTKSPANGSLCSSAPPTGVTASSLSSSFASSTSPSPFPCAASSGCPAAGASFSTTWPPDCMLWV